MISFVVRHLLESTFFCVLLSGLALCLRRCNASARYTVLLMSVCKFVIPTIVLARTGEELASFWPAASWLLLATYKVSAVFMAIQSLVPLNHERDFFTAWCVGTLVMLAIWLLRLRSLRASYILPTADHEAALFRMSRRFRIGDHVTLQLTNPSVEPALRGIHRPVITVPVGLLDKLTPGEVDGVLLHELAHAERRDNLFGAIPHVVVCLFWFHPLLWLVERRLMIEREHACDERVLACGVDPRTYAAGILKVCQFHLFDTVPGISAMTGADLKRRLELILDRPALGPPRVYVPWLLATGLAAFMTLVPVAGGYCQQCAQSSFDSASPARCPNPATCAQAFQKSTQ